jgi:crotonobetainyl-CoA:carnitine CoA-transferase CaiB-like acyl-CoA transferase
MNLEAPMGALTGLKVIEICSTIAGPACTRLLGDFGADVIKIEPPEGDPVRQMGQHLGDVSLYAASILRNKRSIALDLKSAEGRAIAEELIALADILVENNRPGVMERLGLGYDVLSARNPGLVMVRISGYGQTGPYAERPGYGAICEAVGGVRHMTGDPDRPPARVALATTDYLSSVYAAFGAMTAIHARTRTGRGQVVDVALYEAAFSQMEPVVPAYEKLGLVPQREGANLPSMAPNSLYPSRDGGWVLIAANSNPTWKRLVAIMQQPELLTDPRFETIQQRGKPDNMKAIDAIISAWSRSFDAAPLEEMLRQGEVPTVAGLHHCRHLRRPALCRTRHAGAGAPPHAGPHHTDGCIATPVRHAGNDSPQRTCAGRKRAGHSRQRPASGRSTYPATDGKRRSAPARHGTA